MIYFKIAQGQDKALSYNILAMESIILDFESKTRALSGKVSSKKGSV